MPEKQNLVSKLAAIMGEIDHVEKRGRNTFHNYNYVKASDLAHAVRSKMVEKNVFMTASVSRVDRYSFTQETKNGAKEQQAIIVDVQYTFRDGGSDETISFMIPGCGADAGDKGLYKALTGSLKYALREQFLIPDDTEPENEDKGAVKEEEPSVEKTIAEAFRRKGVSVSEIEKKIGHPLTKLDEDEINTLRSWLVELNTAKEEETKQPPAPRSEAKPEVNHTPAPAGDEPRPGEKKEDSDRKLTKEEWEAIRAELARLGERINKSDLKKYLLKTGGAKRLEDISKVKFDTAMKVLRYADEVGTIDKLFKGGE